MQECICSGQRVKKGPMRILAYTLQKRRWYLHISLLDTARMRKIIFSEVWVINFSIWNLVHSSFLQKEKKKRLLSNSYILTLLHKKQNPGKLSSPCDSRIMTFFFYNQGQQEKMPLAIIGTNLNLAARWLEFMDLIIKRKFSTGQPADYRNKLDTSAAMTL